MGLNPTPLHATLVHTVCYNMYVYICALVRVPSLQTLWEGVMSFRGGRFQFHHAVQFCVVVRVTRLGRYMCQWVWRVVLPAIDALPNAPIYRFLSLVNARYSYVYGRRAHCFGSSGSQSGSTPCSWGCVGST